MSYTRLIYHIIFRTKDSEPTIAERYEEDLYRYIWGIVKNKGGVLGRINSMPNHIHLLVELPPDVCVSDFVRSLKLSTNNFMQQHAEQFPRFRGWARKYCALTYGVSEREKIVNYIKGQKQHHRTVSYEDELKNLLEEFGVQYDKTYLMHD